MREDFPRTCLKLPQPRLWTATRYRTARSLRRARVSVMSGERWSEIVAFAGHVLSALLIAWGVVSRRAVLVLVGLGLSVIVVGARVAPLVDWWLVELLTILVLLAIGALVIVLTRR